jgi:hypothetical protein
LFEADFTTRVEFALIVGPLVALAVFGWSLRERLSSGATIDADSITEALHTLPLADI